MVDMANMVDVALKPGKISLGDYGINLGTMGLKSQVAHKLVPS